MAEIDGLLEQFEANGPRLRGVAYRMLGSLSEAEDAVQDAWLRLSRADVSEVANLNGWLTTVVARVCLDMLRSRQSRREESLDAGVAEPIAAPQTGSDPEEEVLLADSVGLALLVVLETLAPPERLAFVLHDMFAMPFEEIAPIVGKSPAAARQLASRARRRVQGAPAVADVDVARQRSVVEAYLAAARGGDFEGLLAVLDPDVALRADPGVLPGATTEIRGARAVAELAMARRAGRFAQPMLVDGAVGVVVAPGGRPRLALAFTITDGRVAGIDVITDPARLRRLEFGVLDAGRP